MYQGFISGKKHLARFLDCGENKVDTLIKAGLPKHHNGNSWVFRIEEVTEWYTEYLDKNFPIQEVKFNL